MPVRTRQPRCAPAVVQRWTEGDARRGGVVLRGPLRPPRGTPTSGLRGCGRDGGPFRGVARGGVRQSTPRRAGRSRPPEALAGRANHHLLMLWILSGPRCSRHCRFELSTATELMAWCCARRGEGRRPLGHTHGRQSFLQGMGKRWCREGKPSGRGRAPRRTNEDSAVFSIGTACPWPR